MQPASCPGLCSFHKTDDSGPSGKGTEFSQGLQVMREKKKVQRAGTQSVYGTWELILAESPKQRDFSSLSQSWST